MKVDKVVKIFKTLAQNPSPSSARIVQPGPAHGKCVTIVSTWSQRNLERGKSVKFQQTHFVDSATQKATDMLPVDVSFEQMSSLSKSGELRAVVRDVPQDSNGSRKQYLEIWKHHQLYRNFDLPALEVHGDVYTDDEFASLDWSPCGTKLLYVAERKVPKSEPFYKPKPQECKENGVSSCKPTQKGEEYTFRAEWGEQLIGKHQPVVIICDVKTQLLRVLEAIPSEYSPAQVCWAPDGQGIIGVAWKNEPRRLGLVYCTNRKSVIFHLTLDGRFEVLSVEGQAVRSPRFSPDGKYLVWLERTAGGPHHSGHKLMCCTWSTRKVHTVVDLVRQQVNTTSGAPFFGLYGQKLPQRCWASDSCRLLLSTPQRCRNVSFVINVETGSICELEWPVPEGCTQGSGTIMDVSSDLVVMSRSSLREPAGLVLGSLPPMGLEQTIQWIPVTAWTPPTDLQSFELRYMTLEAKNTSDSFRTFDAIYFGPSGEPDNSVALVVYPHGGPHSAFTDEFSLNCALLTLMGYGVLLVNYRGSTGRGEDSINFLLKWVGDADVKDVHQAKEAALQEFPCLNRQNCVLFGGSHGGFLVAHLSGQYPDEYRAVVARNPVVDVACMSGISDIPDWCFVEAGLEYNPAAIVTKEDLEKMHNASPIKYVSKVKAPTLLMLGKKDLRVPYSQGLMYYHALHANGITAKVHVYEDSHALGQVSVEMDNIINSVLWFEEHLQ